MHVTRLAHKTTWENWISGIISAMLLLATKTSLMCIFRANKNFVTAQGIVEYMAICKEIAATQDVIQSCFDT